MEDLPFLRGVNLASGSFGSEREPRKYGHDYIYPRHSSVDYFASKGINFFRITFLWESMQPVLSGPLSSAELQHLDEVVSYATEKGLFIAIDAHNYAKFHGKRLGAELPFQVLGDLWSRLAEHYKNNERVLFDIMNEPNNMPTQAVMEMSQVAINAIREAGSANVILVEGNQWSGAWHWRNSGSEVLAELIDPKHNLVFSPHQYLNAMGSGASPECVNNNVGVERLRSVTEWGRERRVRLLLGEFGSGADAVCQAAVTSMLHFIHEHTDVWVGWAWWAGGPWWGTYFTSIEPENGLDRPQMKWLTPAP
jgi:endoglucanase